MKPSLKGLMACAITATAISSPAQAWDLGETAENWLINWSEEHATEWFTDKFYLPGTETLAAGEMRVSACGTGMPATTKKQAAACFVIETGNGQTLLFDIGSGSYANITALQISPDALDTVFLTHLHTDHMGDLGTLWAGGWVSGRTGPLEVYGPTGRLPELGTAAAIEGFQAFTYWDQQTRAANISPIPGNINVHEFDFRAVNQVVYDNDGVVVRTVPAIHTGDGPVSYIIEYAGQKVAYSGDTFPTRNFLEAAAGADLLIHEVFTTPQQTMDTLGLAPPPAMTVSSFVHTTPEAFGKVAELVGADHAVGFHFFNNPDIAEEIEAGIRNVYTGPLSLAQDLMVWNIQNGEVKERMTVDSPEAIPALGGVVPPALRTPECQADPSSNPMCAAPFPFTLGPNTVLATGAYQQIFPVMNPRLDAFCSKYGFCGVPGADWRVMIQQMLPPPPAQ
jgi:ribonuclease Z